MKIVSLFAGAGGLDLGFNKAGFDIIWANEYDKDIWETYELNHHKTYLCKKSITDVAVSEIPDCDGIIGGPPCQSWSEAGAMRGIGDKRGQLFFDFIRILDAKKPKFFLAENVSGMLLDRHSDALESIKHLFTECGYTLSFRLLNANDYDVPQDRQRVFFIGFRHDLNINFEFPKPSSYKPVLNDCIKDLEEDAIPAKSNNHTNGNITKFPNNEYMVGGFSTIYMSRNRVRGWHEPSFTIQAGGRHAPIHPSAPKMKFILPNVRVFEPGYEQSYRRLSVRECARIQTFPDNFIFKYKNLISAYKMIGNAVPVNFGFAMANAIKNSLGQSIESRIAITNAEKTKKTVSVCASSKISADTNSNEEKIVIGYYKSSQQDWITKNNLYNLRADKSFNDDNFFSAKYLLLYSENESVSQKLFKIIEYPKILNKNYLIKTGYNNPNNENYLVYRFELINSGDLVNSSWDIKSLLSSNCRNRRSKPFVVSKKVLLQAKVL